MNSYLRHQLHLWDGVILSRNTSWQIWKLSPLCVSLSVRLWSFLRRQRWTCCQSRLMSHPILIITFTFILHPLSRASTQFSVPPALLLSSHPPFPSSTTTWGATTCPLPPLKTPRRRTSSRDPWAIGGLCESSHCLVFVCAGILVMNIRWNEAPLISCWNAREPFFYDLYFLL